VRNVGYLASYFLVLIAPFRTEPVLPSLDLFLFINLLLLPELVILEADSDVLNILQYLISYGHVQLDYTSSQN